MRTYLLSFCLVPVLLVGCAETGDACPNGLVRFETTGECVDLDAGSIDGGMVDGGEVDAGTVDAGTDAAVDGGACGQCDAPNFCAEGACVQCTEAETDGCPTDRPFCMGGTCVEYLSAADCGGTTPVCAGTVCRACNDTMGDCDGAAGPLCQTSGACTGCRVEADCGGKVCNRLTNLCTTRNPGDIGTCGTCFANQDCASGACVFETFEEPAGTPVALGYVCTLTTTGSCGDTDRPYTRFVSGQATIDPEVTVTACRLTTAATCAARLDFTNECTAADTCGEDSLGTDGLCQDILSGGSRLDCTYRCSGNSECPDGAFVCNTDVGYCVRT